MKRRAILAGVGAAIAGSARLPALGQSTSMTALINAAKAEGSVVVDGPPVDAVREAIVTGFQRAYGIPVSWISSGTSASGARVRAERAAGKYLLDVLISGPDTPTVTFLPNGWLDKIEPILIAPDVIDKHKWKDGHLWYEDEGTHDPAFSAICLSRTRDQYQARPTQRGDDLEVAAQPEMARQAHCEGPRNVGLGRFVDELLLHHVRTGFRQEALRRSETDALA